MATSDLEHLTALLSRMPGLGPRSARRAVLHLIKRRESALLPLISHLQAVSESLRTCDACGNIDTQNPCAICADTRRENNSICVVADVADLWAMERAQNWRGTYHVLGGELSAMDGVHPEDLTVVALINRVRIDKVQEVVLALSATLEGQATSHLLIDRLSPLNIRITTLAHGVPVGGELDYLDEGTLALAMKARRVVEQ
jgi:recombination protein RecR